jgi:hypothetical protein
MCLLKEADAMKRIMRVCALFFVLVFGFNCNSFAENDIYIDVDMWKDVFSHGEYYGCEIEIEGYAVKDVDWVLVLVPSNELLCVRNTLGLNELGFEAWGMRYEEFASRFPVGLYTVFLLPQLAQSMSVHMNHNFPATPVITYPADGATNVPTDATITWEPMTGIHVLYLSIENKSGQLDLELEIDLPINSTSFTLPTGLLQSNTEYELWLEAEISDGRGNDLETCRCVYFTTAGE